MNELNSLNSLLVEGKVSEIMTTEQAGIKMTTFILTSVRFLKVDEENVGMEETKIMVRTTGNLAGACAKNLTDGRGVRIVGRIAMHGERVVAVAEHVELKPAFKQHATVEGEA